MPKSNYQKINQINLRTISEKTQGLIQIKPKIKVTDSFMLSLVYTPGVGQNCLEIKNKPDTIYDYTMVSNAVAIVTDGSGRNITHQNELIPQLEAQAAFQKFFYNVDAYPFILDNKLCQSEDDLLLAIENLAPVYKVINLVDIDDKKIQALLPKLAARKLPITILHKNLWKGIISEDKNGDPITKEYLKVQIIEAAIIRAILDRRCYLCASESPLQDLVNLTWGICKDSLNNLPSQISESLLNVYQTALEFLTEGKFSHPTVKDVSSQYFIDRMVNFYIYGKVSFIQPWDVKHQIQKESTNQNSLLLHKRYGGMISIAPRFKPRSLGETYNIFKRSYENGDIKSLEQDIKKNPDLANEVTFKHNLLAIMTNGTAILGLGDIGPSAGLPVMEGKSVLFKSLAGINVIPICIKEKDPVIAVHVMRMLSPIFSAINLEDIKAPECFEIEKRMIEGTNIPVMHDDQHGTAVIVLAAILNGLKLMKKKPGEINLVVNGAGAAGLAICELLYGVGVTNIIICDTEGAIYQGRPKNMNNFKNKLAQITNKNKKQGPLSDIVKGADIFIGVSIGGALTQAMVKSMNSGCFILALANPNPEILPDQAKEAGAFIIATGRSDFKNQVNNSLAFPGIFKGAMETKSKIINKEMMLAAAHAIANIVNEKDLNPDFILPAALNAELPAVVARAVAEAAIKTGVAQRTDICPQEIYSITRKLNMEGLIPLL